MTQINLTEDTHSDISMEKLTPADPYQDKTPVNFIEREYLIQENVLTVGQEFIFRPFEDLLSKTTISRYLSLFRYIRAGVRIRVVILSTPMQYGVIGIGSIPYCQLDNKWRHLDQFSQSDLNLIDVCEQESFVLRMPYVSQNNYYDLAPGAVNPGLWRVTVKCMALETCSIATSESVSIKIFASFYDSETAGYLPAVYQSGQLVMDRTNNFPAMPSPLGALTVLAAPTLMGAVRLYNTVYEYDIPGYIASMWAAIKWANTAVKEVESAKKNVESVFGGSQPKVEDAPDDVPPDNSKEDKCVAPETRIDIYRGQGNNTLAKKTAVQKDVKLDITSELSAPAITLNHTSLGDDFSKDFKLPGIRNAYLLKDITCKPTIINSYYFQTTADIHDIIVTPDYPKHYFHYIMKMFKYFKSGTNIMINFYGSPLISARIRITLFPAGIISDSLENVADLPTWIITIKGSSKFKIAVPYLQKTPWVTPGSYVAPVLRLELLENLPQPYDKALSIVALAFGSTAEDIQFAGLQSYNSAIYQCSLIQEFATIKLESNVPHHSYMGGVDDIYQILGRFSTRKPDPEFFLPRPIKIQTNSEYSRLDNFDYLCNLYLFATGDVNVKLLFSESPSGILQVALGNNGSLNPDTQFNAGNSINMSVQTVWPTLDFVYPYLSNVDFEAQYMNSFNQPITYPFLIDPGAVIQKYFISASEYFGLATLLPVPDFLYLEGALYQSAPLKYYRPNAIVGYLDTTTTTPYGNSQTVDLTLPAPTATYSIYFELTGTIMRTSGSDDNIASITLASNPNNTLMVSTTYLASTYCSSVVNLVGSNPIEFRSQGCFYGVWGTPSINFRLFNSSASSVYRMWYSLKVSPYNAINAISSIQNDNTVETEISSSVTISGTVSTSLDASSVTQEVHVTNNPLTVDGFVGVANITPIPIHGLVTIDNSVLNVAVSTDSPVPVVGVSDYTLPKVRVTNY